METCMQRDDAAILLLLLFFCLFFTLVSSSLWNVWTLLDLAKHELIRLLNMLTRIFSHGSQTPERHFSLPLLPTFALRHWSRIRIRSSADVFATRALALVRQRLRYCGHRVRLPVCHLWMVSSSVPVRRWQSDTHSSQTLYLLSTLLLLLVLFLGMRSERELNHTADSTQRGRSGNRRSESGCLSSIISSMTFLLTLIWQLRISCCCNYF